MMKLRPLSVLRMDSGEESAQFHAPVIKTAEVDCGLSKCCTIQRLEKYANHRVFVIFLSVVGLVHGAAEGYFRATINNVGQRYNISPELLESLMLASKVSQSLVALAIGYYGGKGRRPRWVGFGFLVEAITCGLLVLPRVLYGPMSVPVTNNKSPFLCDVTRSENRSRTTKTGESWWVTVSLLFLTQFGFGIGSIVFMAHGLTYLDDNVLEKNSPALLAVVIGVRSLGPKIGMLLAFPGIWWLGWPILGSFLAVGGILIAMFPVQLPKMVVMETAARILGASQTLLSSEPENLNEEAAPSRGFRPSLRRIITNKMMMLNILASVFYEMASSNFMLLENKFLQAQYLLPPPQGGFQDPWVSRVITGLMKPPFVALAVIVSGLAIARGKPRARFVAGWNVFIAAIATALAVSCIFLACKVPDINGQTEKGLTQSCNMDCNCNHEVQFYPVCSEDKITHYSPCHAGCKNYGNNMMDFKDCSCVILSGERNVNSGLCNFDCSAKYITFESLSLLLSVLSASGMVGNMLLCFRCVQHQDKPSAVAIEMFLVGLISYGPGWHLYKVFIDNTCQMWDKDRDVCYIYDPNTFRLSISILTASLIFIGMLLDIGVCYLSKEMDLYGVETDESELEIETASFMTYERKATPHPKRRRKVKSYPSSYLTSNTSSSNGTSL